jgi:hypothetical protein
MVKPVKYLLLMLLPVTLVLILLEILFRVIGYDFEDPTHGLARVPVYYRVPTMLVGEAFYRRPGPQTWTGRVISQELERQGVLDDLTLYENEPVIQVSYDRDGFRNSRNLADWEVVVVGDSFVELGYLADEELFTTQLASRLGIRVRNLGASGAGPLTSIAYLESFGKAPSARHAVLLFYEGNDLTDLRREHERLRAVRSGEAKPGDRLLEREPQTSLARAVLRAWPSATATRRPRSSRNSFYRNEGGELVPITVYNAPPPWRELDPNLQLLFVRTLRRWGQAAEALGMKPWLLYMPCKLRVLHDRIQLDPRMPEHFRSWSPNDLPESVEAISRRLELGFIDATPCLMAETRAGSLAYNTVFDAHLNRRGSGCVADALAAAIGPHLERVP